MASISSALSPRVELTLRGLILGVVITVVFTAANVYFGLKAGLTFATSIPAAVISMAVLRGVQGRRPSRRTTSCRRSPRPPARCPRSSSCCPGLVMIGWWTGFPYWVSFAICALGGMLGVMYSIPLRRALVTSPTCPTPKGVACAEVLKVGGGERRGTRRPRRAAPGLLAVLWGSVVSAAFAVHRRDARVRRRRRALLPRRRRQRGHAASTSSCRSRCSRVGHLVGLWVGVAMLVGRADRLGVGRAAFSALLRTPAPARLAHWRARPGATRCASSAPAPSAWPRSGRWPSWSSR